MNEEFFEALNLLEREKGIPKDYMLERVKMALLAAFRKQEGIGKPATKEERLRDEEEPISARVEIDEERGEIKLYKLLTVVDNPSPDGGEGESADAAAKRAETPEENIPEPDDGEGEDAAEDGDEPDKPAARPLDKRYTISLDEAQKIEPGAQVGDVLEIEQKTKEFLRTAAQAAKQVIIQGIREFERSEQIIEYENRREDILTGVVDRVEPNGDIILITESGTVALRKNEQLPGDRFAPGQHVKVFVSEVVAQSASAGSRDSITVSRTHPHFVKRLFETEIPEVSEGTVRVVNVAREAGSRTKIAVASEDARVDPVGACIGTHSSRINPIIEELKGEKIDVIPYSEELSEYVKAALSPAKPEDVIVSADRDCRVIVAPEQLSLAIGKEGQNARLAARLTGTRVDIKTTKE